MSRGKLQEREAHRRFPTDRARSGQRSKSKVQSQRPAQATLRKYTRVPKNTYGVPQSSLQSETIAVDNESCHILAPTRPYKLAAEKFITTSGTREYVHIQTLKLAEPTPRVGFPEVQIHSSLDQASSSDHQTLSHAKLPVTHSLHANAERLYLRLQTLSHRTQAFVSH